MTDVERLELTVTGYEKANSLLLAGMESMADSYSDMKHKVRRLEERNRAWYLAARAALADQIVGADWKNGDPWPEPDTTELYAMYRGCGWADVPEPMAKILCDQRDAAYKRIKMLEEANALQRRALDAVYEILKPADAEPPPFDHSACEVRQWTPGLGPCMCPDCRDKPLYLPGKPQ